MTKTPSAPLEKARRIRSGLTIPEHIIRTMRRLGGYCERLTPARSAAANAHHVQRNPMIVGLKSSDMDEEILSVLFDDTTDLDCGPVI